MPRFATPVQLLVCSCAAIALVLALAACSPATGSPASPVSMPNGRFSHGDGEGADMKGDGPSMGGSHRFATMPPDTNQGDESNGEDEPRVTSNPFPSHPPNRPEDGHHNDDASSDAVTHASENNADGAPMHRGRPDHRHGGADTASARGPGEGEDSDEESMEGDIDRRHRHRHRPEDQDFAEGEDLAEHSHPQSEERPMGSNGREEGAQYHPQHGAGEHHRVSFRVHVRQQQQGNSYQFGAGEEGSWVATPHSEDIDGLEVHIRDALRHRYHSSNVTTSIDQRGDGTIDIDVVVDVTSNTTAHDIAMQAINGSLITTYSPGSGTPIEFETILTEYTPYSSQQQESSSTQSTPVGAILLIGGVAIVVLFALVGTVFYVTRGTRSVQHVEFANPLAAEDAA